MRERPFDLVIFDLDGVLTDTAEYHYRAWKRLADEEGLPFDRTVNDQLRGVSRARSLEIILNGRRVSPQKFREMLERKNRYYRELLQQLTPRDLLPGALQLVRSLRDAGIKVAIGTVSKNAPLIVERLRLDKEVDLVADGHAVKRSKPAPDVFLYAALRLGVSPERAVVLEDAAAGIDAALAAGMWAVGVGPRERLEHAHVVLPDLVGWTADRLMEVVAHAQQDAALWCVEETTLPTRHAKAREPLFAVGNGYVGTRGTFEEAPSSESVNLVHGMWDDVPIFHTELVNVPNWTGVELNINGECLRLSEGTVLAYWRQLNMHDGLMRRRVRWQSPAGAVVDVVWERFAVWQEPHWLAQRVWVTPVDGTLDVTIRLLLQGWQSNPEVLHWQECARGEGWICMQTRHTGRDVVVGQVVRPWGTEPVEESSCGLPGQWGHEVHFRLQPGMFAGVDRLVAIYTDREADAPMARVQEDIQRLSTTGYDDILSAHRRAWRDLWRTADVIIEGDDVAQRAIRFNIYHLLIAAPRLTERTSIGAKTLTGFGYRGHIFWDTEIFMLPFFTYVQPETARRLLMYRYHTLPGARRKAAANGFSGAQYAWESAETGDEVTPRWVPLPDGSLVRIWCGDIELHISSDIPYAIWQYWRVSGDDAFLRDYGARIILETALFWESRVEWNATHSRYELTDVIGPDEYHEHVNNNAYTNEMVRWHLERALDVMTWLQQHTPERLAAVSEELMLTPKRLAHWQHVHDHLFVPRDATTGLIEQFEGFFHLEDVDLTAYEPREQSMQAILGIEGANKRQVLKQPDVLMLLYLLPERFDERTLRVNWDYYVPRTDHTYGSSLGPAIHAILAAWLGHVEDAYVHFMRSALVDLDDVRGNAADGIHGASCGGTWQAVVFGFAGLRVGEDGWQVNPHLPHHWKRVAFRFYYRGELQEVEIEGAEREKGHASSSSGNERG